MNEIVKPFDRYNVHYATTNPQGRDLTRIEFFYRGSKVGQLLSSAAIGPGSFVSVPDEESSQYFGSFVSLRNDEINLYFESAMLANALALLQRESDLALYFVPDPVNPQREQGGEGGICHNDGA